MTPSERERRIERATTAISDQFEQGYRTHWCEGWQKDGRCERCTKIAEAALDAADVAVPMVSEEIELEQRAERAEAAARDFAGALRLISLFEPAAATMSLDDPFADAQDHARTVLARHPSFSGEEGTGHDIAT